MNDIINTKGLDISKPKSFAEFVELAKELQGQLDLAWGVVEQQMLDRNVKSLKGDWGSATIGERKNWKATTELPPRFYKKSLDTSKLNFMLGHGDTLPAGAEFTTKQYLTKRVK
jgi:hypothetical protein